MTKEFAALIFIGLLVLVVLVYAVFSTRERSGAVEARLAAMSGLGGANEPLSEECAAGSISAAAGMSGDDPRDDGGTSVGMVSQAEHRS